MTGGSPRPTVSAVVVNWNGANHLADALPSLRDQSYASMDTIVVDNGSTDDSRRICEGAGATWLPLGKNAGFGPALNAGARAANGEILLLLNNDMRFERDFVLNMVEQIALDSNVFAVDAVQYDWEGSRVVHQATFVSDEKPEDGSDAAEIVPGLYTIQRPVPGAISVMMSSGANLMIRRDRFLSLGGLDERMPIGFEDFDICWRGLLRGWKIMFAPDAVCWHRISAASSSEAGQRSRFHGTLAGRLLFATKLLPRRYAAAAWGATLGGFARDLTSGARNGYYPAERARVILNAAGYLPELLRERTALFASANQGPDQLLRSLIRLDPERAAAV